MVGYARIARDCNLRPAPAFASSVALQKQEATMKHVEDDFGISQNVPFCWLHRGMPGDNHLCLFPFAGSPA